MNYLRSNALLVIWQQNWLLTELLSNRGQNKYLVHDNFEHSFISAMSSVYINLDCRSTIWWLVVGLSEYLCAQNIYLLLSYLLNLRSQLQAFHFRYIFNESCIYQCLGALHVFLPNFGIQITKYGFNIKI